MLEQLHRYTHEIINALSALKNVFGGVGDIFHCVGFNNNQFIDRLNPLLKSSGFSFLHIGLCRLIRFSVQGRDLS